MNADKWWNDVYTKRMCKIVGGHDTTEHEYNIDCIEDMMRDVARLAYEAGTKRLDMQDSCTCMAPVKIGKCEHCGGTIYVLAPKN